MALNVECLRMIPLLDHCQLQKLFISLVLPKRQAFWGIEPVRDGGLFQRYLATDKLSVFLGVLVMVYYELLDGPGTATIIWSKAGTNIIVSIVLRR